jgi:hypothetical protein
MPALYLPQQRYRWKMWERKGWMFLSLGLRVTVFQNCVSYMKEQGWNDTLSKEGAMSEIVHFGEMVFAPGYRHFHSLSPTWPG